VRVRIPPVPQRTTILRPIGKTVLTWQYRALRRRRARSFVTQSPADLEKPHFKRIPSPSVMFPAGLATLSWAFSSAFQRHSGKSYMGKQEVFLR